MQFSKLAVSHCGSWFPAMWVSQSKSSILKYNRELQINKFISGQSQMIPSENDRLECTACHMLNHARSQNTHSWKRRLFHRCTGQFNDGIQPLHVCAAKVARLRGNNLRHCPRRGHVCVLLNPGNPHSEFLICLCKRDWEMIRRSSASLE